MEEEIENVENAEHTHKYKLQISSFQYVDNEHHNATYTKICEEDNCPDDEKTLIEGPMLEEHILRDKIWYDKAKNTDVAQCRRCGRPILLNNHTHRYETYLVDDKVIHRCECGDYYADSLDKSVVILSQMNKLAERIEYIETIFGDNDTYDKVLLRLLDDSWYIGLSLRYPYRDFSKLMLPSKYWNWHLRCCEQLYKLIGTAGIKSYAENGLSWTRDSAYLPYELTNEIEPIVGYIVSDDDKEDIKYV